jgi:hypothetical protein
VIRSRSTLVVLLAVLIAAGCSSGGDDSSAPSSTSATTGTTAAPRPAGPAADLSTELTGGNGPYMGAFLPMDLGDAGYEQDEYAASGTATSYRPTGPLTSDGRWIFAPDASAPYRTRVLVRRPADETKFSGTVVVEWLNVTGGAEFDPEWWTTHEEILRRGDAWVGVSAQRIGVEGGPIVVQVDADVPGAANAGKGLKAIDAERYGSLEHPGDGFAFDMYTQVARAIRAGSGMNGLQSERVIAAGQSQSAFAMVTYYNGVQPLTQAFDGFFVHSRAAGSLPLVGPGEYADIVGALGSPPSIFRTDQQAPVFDLQTETDVTGLFNSSSVRQPDTDVFRLWEVAGTAHYDKVLLPVPETGSECGAINDGPLHVVAKAGLRSLETWVETGEVPLAARPINVTPDTPPRIVRDQDGIALGGIRTPPVDVPVETLSGAPGPSPSVLCSLLGSTTPFSDARLEELYPTRTQYEFLFGASADATIGAGFVLDDDRDALMDYADPSRIPK